MSEHTTKRFQADPDAHATDRRFTDWVMNQRALVVDPNANNNAAYRYATSEGATGSDSPGGPQLDRA